MKNLLMTELLLIVVMVLAVMNSSTVAQDQLTQEMVCSAPPGKEENPKVQSITVTKAFKAAQMYVILYADIKYDNKVYKDVILSVMYQAGYDVSRFLTEVQHPFYEFHVWPALAPLNHYKGQILFAFDTQDIQVWDSGDASPTSQASFIVTKKQGKDTGNMTYGLWFKPEINEQSSLTNLEIGPKSLSNSVGKEIYNQDTEEDNSNELNIKLLFFHFPAPDLTKPEVPYVTILDMVVFKVDGLYNKLNDTQYYAIVYTEEKSGNKYVYYRHYVRAKRIKYEYNGVETYYRLRWQFDDRNQFCGGELGYKVNAVVLLNKVGFDSAQVDESGTSMAFNVEMAEFIEDKIFRFNFTFKSDGTFGPLPIYKTSETTTNKDGFKLVPAITAVHWCAKHPEYVQAKPIECSQDYDTARRSGSDDDSGSTFWQILWIILTLIAIIVVVGYGIYLGVKMRSDSSTLPTKAPKTPATAAQTSAKPSAQTPGQTTAKPAAPPVAQPAAQPAAQPSPKTEAQTPAQTSPQSLAQNSAPTENPRSEIGP